MTLAGRRIDVRGTVQGVGFRPWVYRLAERVGVTGSVHNGPSGVTIEAFAEEGVLDEFVDRLRAEPPETADIVDLEWRSISPDAPCRFVIAPSEHEGARRAAIPADLATCPACLAELADPRARRYRYPFTNCTACGPRYSIALDTPYDRAATTMAPFVMCAACRQEYTTVTDRRFHAEPIACPDCGPRLRLYEARRELTGDPLLQAAALLRDGAIVAVKGLGGYHLACDACSDEAVALLRARKRRDAKPFAVMVRDLAMAAELVEIAPDARALLESVARPIVLLPRRAMSDLSPLVAPDAPRLGLMLPYTPLHHLLLEAVDRPLVMTSGNLSGEPIVHRDEEAVERLGAIADAFLAHDRPIAAPTDDSVVALIGSAPVMLRRSRGYVPRPLRAAPPFSRPLLACGAQLKNAFCIGKDDEAYLGPHIGDLDGIESYDAFVAAVERSERFLRVRPEIIAHDLHPDYLSSRYARARAASEGLLRIAVQHHHAHVVSVMAEHALEGPVIGVAYDGTGLGSDGALWGGEILLARYDGFERLATLRPLSLAGGEVAIHQVWRLALAALDDAFDGEPPIASLPLFETIDRRDIAVVRRMIGAGFNAPAAHGAGRWFDAFGALVLGRREARYEGHVAMALERAADASERGRYRYDVSQDSPLATIDLRPAVREAVGDLRYGRSPAVVSARVHNTLVAATAERVRAALDRTGPLPVALSGGCFQNARLAASLERSLMGAAVYKNLRIPPNDGGIALGQAAIANALGRRTGEQSCA